LLKRSYIKITRRFTYFLVLVFLWASAIPQTGSKDVTIRGKAHSSYIGKIIQLFSVSDYITNTLIKETQDTIENDGFFELKYQADFIQPLTLKIDNVISKLYVQPNFMYGITIPEAEKDLDYNNGMELELNIGVIGVDSTELNALMFDYQTQHNKLFIPKEGQYINRTKLIKSVDSLKKMCGYRYKNIDNIYFTNYVEYSIATINAGLSRGENFLINEYVISKPVQYNHYEYMQFFNTCFKGYLNNISSARKGPSLYHIINMKADWDELNLYLRQDKFLKNDTLRELVAIKNLYDFYYSADFAPDAVKQIISQLHLQTSIAYHKKITNTMLVYFNNMKPGMAAPAFKVRNINSAIYSSDELRKRWVYLNFFSTKNIQSLKEMPKILSLKKKYGDKLAFISISVDDNFEDYKTFIKVNPKYNWPILYNYDVSILKTAKEKYSVTGNEAYFLINNFGYLSQSPALPPSGGIEHKLNAIFKPAKTNNKIGIR
jgi:thiol-disulfide isomerase/thioredoxin